MIPRHCIRRRPQWVLCWFLLFWFLPFSHAGSLLSYAPAPVDNPLKGLVPYDGVNTNFPHSLEFFYLPVRSLQSDYTNFDWTPLESKLNAIGQRGHQAVFRLFLDYPNVPSGMPTFLAHVPVREYGDYGNGNRARSVSPDYDHPDLRRALTNLISALGGRYDADPRVGFITAGLLGFWGEWHTYPYNGFDRPTNWFASAATQREVLDAFDAAFHTTPVLLREPKTGVNITRRRLGFHDDSFAYSTLGPLSWHFWPVIKSYNLTNVWKRQPIGGEVRPELWGCLWSEPSCEIPGQEFLRCVETTHASWLMDSGTFRGVYGADRERALSGARRLGYELFVNTVEMPARAAQGVPVRISVTVTNTGVAPFYYRWPVVIGVLGADGTLRRHTNEWDLTTILPNEAPRQFQFDVPTHNMPSGTHAVLLSVPNPLPKGQPLRFANQTQDATLAGWLSLGQVEIAAAPRLRAPRLERGVFEMKVDELRTGVSVEVQQSESLHPSGWTTIDQFTPVDSGQSWQAAPVGGLSGFFRVLQRP